MLQLITELSHCAPHACPTAAAWCSCDAQPFLLEWHYLRVNVLVWHAHRWSQSFVDMWTWWLCHDPNLGAYYTILVLVMNQESSLACNSLKTKPFYIIYTSLGWKFSTLQVYIYSYFICDVGRCRPVDQGWKFKMRKFQKWQFLWPAAHGVTPADVIWWHVTWLCCTKFSRIAYEMERYEFSAKV